MRKWLLAGAALLALTLASPLVAISASASPATQATPAIAQSCAYASIHGFSDPWYLWNSGSADYVIEQGHSPTNFCYTTSATLQQVGTSSCLAWNQSGGYVYEHSCAPGAAYQTWNLIFIKTGSVCYAWALQNLYNDQYLTAIAIGSPASLRAKIVRNGSFSNTQTWCAP